MSYKDQIFDQYASLHTNYVKGVQSHKALYSNYKAWDYYYSKYFPKSRESPILDVGCGQGEFVQYLHEKGYSDTWGVDISSEQIERGKKRNIRNLLQADAFNYFSKYNNHYQLIVFRDVLEHFEREEAFQLLTSVHKSLRPNGKILVQVPNGEGIFSRSIIYGDITHEFSFTHQSIRQLLLASGFHSVSFRGTGPVPKNLKGVIRLFLWKAIVTVYKIGKAIETGKRNGIFTSNLIAVAEK